MPSTHSPKPVSRAAYALLLLSAAFISSTSAQNLRTMEYKGCYSSSKPLTDQGEDMYQTSGLCQPICVKKDQAVLGLTEGSNCFCGDMLPAEDSKVSDDKCDTHCNGYKDEMCGGHNYWSVYTSGTKNNVDSYEDDSSSSSSSSSSTTAASSSTTAAPESAAVSTSVAPGTTVVVTMPSSQQQTEAPEPSSSAESDSGGSSPNVAGIAAGVVVGVVAVAGIAVGLFFFMRHRKRKAAEEEYKRTQVTDFMRHGGTTGEGKPPNTGYSNMSDQRLDPEAGRRNSAGSIADDQDYSRRILRVANPDSS